MEGKRVFGFPFPEGCPDGSAFWRDIGTLDAYYETHMELLGADPPFPLHHPDWLIHTYHPPLPPVHLSGAEVEGCLLSPGCRVGSATVRSSVLGPGVTVGDGAVVENSIIFEGCSIGNGARLRKVIMDKFCVVPPDAVIDAGEMPDALHQTVTGGGITVIPRMLNLSVVKP